jgi:ribonuclease P protein component
VKRRYRLRGAAEFARMFRNGRRLEAPRVQLIGAPAAELPGRVGYVIGSKQLARAVDRNRLKRLLREMFRARGPAVREFDIVLRLRRSCTATELTAVAAEAGALLDTLGG